MNNAGSSSLHDPRRNCCLHTERPSTVASTHQPKPAAPASLVQVVAVLCVQLLGLLLLGLERRLHLLNLGSTLWERDGRAVEGRRCGAAQ